MKRIAVLICLLAMILSLSACRASSKTHESHYDLSQTSSRSQSGSSETPDSSESCVISDTSATESAQPIVYDIPIEVCVDVDGAYNGTSATFEVSTNLPEGSELMFTLKSKDSTYQGEAIVANRVASFKIGSSSSPLLENKPYKATVSLSAARFQSESVREIIGEMGENITGPLVSSGTLGNNVSADFEVAFENDTVVITPSGSEDDNSKSGDASSDETEINHPTPEEEKATISAQEHLSEEAFSYSALVEQLEYEFFTHEESVYAVDHCGANWKEQAYRKGREYLSFMSFSSKAAFVEQLESDGFTHKQAVYGAKKNGY